MDAAIQKGVVQANGDSVIVSLAEFHRELVKEKFILKCARYTYRVAIWLRCLWSCMRYIDINNKQDALERACVHILTRRFLSLAFSMPSQIKANALLLKLHALDQTSFLNATSLQDTKDHGSHVSLTLSSVTYYDILGTIMEQFFF